jgi:hypothetical protein
MDIEEAAELAGLDMLINCLVNSWGETVAIFAGALKPAYAAAVKEAKAHYLTPRREDKDIAVANTFAKANEAFIGLGIAYQAVSRRGGSVVLIANAPEGQVVHYLLGAFGRESRGPLGQEASIPPFVNRLIIYTEYPDVAGVAWFPKGDNVFFCHRWDDVLKLLEESHGPGSKVVVYPNAEIQYCA